MGLPYFLPPSTGPLMQKWVAKSVRCAHQAGVSRLLARSNIASLVPRNQALLGQDAACKKTTKIKRIPGLSMWTDQYNNLFKILKYTYSLSP